MQQWPKIDLLEEEDRMGVKADVPGVPKDKLKLSVSEDGITLGFEEEESKEEGGSQGKALRRERYFQSFTRTVPLPGGEQGRRREPRQGPEKGEILPVFHENGSSTRRRRQGQDHSQRRGRCACFILAQ